MLALLCTDTDQHKRKNQTYRIFSLLITKALEGKGHKKRERLG
jgi:hypothetical protein